MKFFVASLAAMVATAQGAVVLPQNLYAGAPLLASPAALPAAYAAAPAVIPAAAPAAIPAPTVSYSAPRYSSAGPVIPAGPSVDPAIFAPKNYALPPQRDIQEAPIVQTYTEPVEQHGYKIRY